MRSKPDRESTPFKDVVLIVSASRSGSSYIAEWLRRRSTAAHLQGELEPLLRAVGAVLRAPLMEGESDADVSFDGERDRATRRVLQASLGRPLASGESLPAKTYAATLHPFLARQWPEEPISVQAVESAIAEVLGDLGWSTVADFEPWPAMLEVLRVLRRTYTSLDPYCYDIPERLVASRFPELSTRPKRPNANCDEDQPFVIPIPWKHVGADALANETIVLKGPSNSYRLAPLSGLFGKERLRILHIVRSPASTINGLIDGWNHRSFHSRPLKRPLELSGLACEADWRRRWWCFDVPPRWEQLTSSTLCDVCTFQWSSANAWILEHRGRYPAPYHRVKFEDFLDEGNTGRAVRRNILEWIKPGDGARACLKVGGRPIMASVLPQRDRWLRRKELLTPILSRAIVKDLGHELGYASLDDLWQYE